MKEISKYYTISSNWNQPDVSLFTTSKINDLVDAPFHRGNHKYSVFLTYMGYSTSCNHVSFRALFDVVDYSSSDSLSPAAFCRQQYLGIVFFYTELFPALQFRSSWWSPPQRSKWQVVNFIYSTSSANLLRTLRLLYPQSFHLPKISAQRPTISNGIINTELLELENEHLCLRGSPVKKLVSKHESPYFNVYP